jgi:hypothetical protein
MVLKNLAVILGYSPHPEGQTRVIRLPGLHSRESRLPFRLPSHKQTMGEHRRSVDAGAGQLPLLAQH